MPAPSAAPVQVFARQRLSAWAKPKHCFINQKQGIPMRNPFSVYIKMSSLAELLDSFIRLAKQKRMPLAPSLLMDNG